MSCRPGALMAVLVAIWHPAVGRSMVKGKGMGVTGYGACDMSQLLQTVHEHLKCTQYIPCRTLTKGTGRHSNLCLCAHAVCVYNSIIIRIKCLCGVGVH